ncbi:MAG: hypothetical protein Kow0099_25250 [Candidatus Abyssubacteria bacterium]
MRRLSIWVMAVVMLAFTVGAFAQPGPPRSDDERPRYKRERMRERIELMRMWKLTEVLDLDEATAEKLFPLMKKHQEKQRALHQERRNIIKQMDAELEKGQPDSAALKGMTKKFMANEEEMVKLRNEQIEEFSEVLTDEQVAKMIVFMPRFEGHVRNLICEARMKHMHRWDGTERRRRAGPFEPFENTPDALKEEAVPDVDTP